MSDDNNNSNPPAADMSRNRRGSVTSAAFTNLFQRSNSTSTGTGVFPGAITTAAMNDQRRRLSISTLGLSGTSPTNTAFAMRRGSLSTNTSESYDESAVDEEEAPPSARTAPTTPFARRTSLGAAAMRRPGANSPGSGNDQGFNWSEQLRSRAESTVAGASRPSFPFGLSSSPPRRGASPPQHSSQHDRAKSVSDMPVPPAQAPKPRSSPRDTRPKPDPFQERILKGDFYMD
ncbi:hypothetical protein NKR23_g7393 [Pleurostoma richardsiae]|uniref:Uncharacterized protein n=1 Tax=Pleurostoma richardsiae TaxID=41990 RepID=A0AA38RI43_9PEZI|nr:hypothetical protein NKR23_g7393 [Pleurostoma richardsiae]